MAGISSRAAGKLQNKYKTFQGQQFDDDLGINWIQFKYRNHDPQIGRFIEIDPLSEKYVYNSTYAFSENKVTSHVELEGLEAVPISAEIFQAGLNSIDKYGPYAEPIAIGTTIVAGLAWLMEMVHDSPYPVGNSSMTLIPNSMDGFHITIPGSMDGTHITIPNTVQAKGSNNPATSSAAKTGQEAHRQIEADLEEKIPGTKTEVPKTLKDGTKVRKDAVLPDGTNVIIKPDTPSGQKSAQTRENLMKKNEEPTQTIFYDPTNIQYQPGSSTYIGPK